CRRISTRRPLRPDIRRGSSCTLSGSADKLLGDAARKAPRSPPGLRMPGYLGALTIALLLGMVFTRVFFLKGQGIEAMKFGNIDKTDFLIPPFAFFYFYVLFAAAFHWPSVSTRQFFHSEIVSWAGVLFCLAGLLLLLWSLISFRQSFRI